MSKKSKVFLQALLLVMIGLTLVGCGSKKNDDEIDDDTPIVSTGAYERGIIDGDTYHSDYLGMTFKLPADHSFLTDSQIQQLLGVGADYLDSDIDVSGVIYEFVSTNRTYESMVTVMTQKVSYEITEEQIIAHLDTAKTQIEANFAAQDAIILDDISTTINGVNMYGFGYMLKVEGMESYGYQYFYMKGKTFTSILIGFNGETGEERIEDILACFSFE